MARKYLIGLSLAVSITAIVCLYKVHSDLIDQREKELMDKQIQIQLLLLYSQDLSVKLSHYEDLVSALNESGCSPPPSFDNGKKQKSNL